MHYFRARSVTFCVSIGAVTLVFLLCAFLATFTRIAHAYYQPGETLDPTCAPSDAGCTIATTTLATAGGTGNVSYASGDILYASTSDPTVLERLAAGVNGQVLKLVGGLPTWASDLIGSGGAGTWATTSDSLAVYPADSSNVVLIGNTATTSSGVILEVTGNALFRGALTTYSTITAPIFTATSTSATSTLPRLSINSAFSIGSDYVTDLTGAGLQAVSGVLTLDTSGDWAGTFDGYDGTYYLTNAFSTTSADFWKTQNNFFSTTSATYWKGVTDFFSTTSVAYWDSTQARWSTTSSDFWKTQNNFFSTTSVAYWDSTQARWSTTSSDYWKSLSNFFSTTSADYWETQQTARNADNLGDNSIEDLSDVAAMTEVYGNILGWNGSNWTNMATTSLGLPTFADLTASAGGALSLVNWYATTTDALDEGSTNLYFTPNRVAGVLAGTSTDALTEGTNNLYWTQQRFNAALLATSSLPYLSVGTSSVALSLSGFDASNYLTTSAWYATTTDALDEGDTNQYFTTGRVQTYLDTLAQGYFFSTTSANYWEAQQSSRTADDLTNNSVEELNDVAAMTEVYGDIMGWNGSSWTNYATSTLGLPTFADLSSTVGNYLSLAAWFATNTDALDEGLTNLYFTDDRVATVIAGTTTTALAEGSNLYYTDDRVNTFINGSSTIPKTYTTNTFTGGNIFGNVTTTNATTTNLYASGTFRGAGLSACSDPDDKLLWNATTGQFECSSDAGADGGLTSLNGDTTSVQTFATTTDTNVGLTITSSGGQHMFTSTWTGTLADSRVADNLTISGGSIDNSPIGLTTPSTAVFTNSTTTNATSTTVYTSTLGVGSDYITDLTGTGLQNTGGVLTLNTLGDWAGTLDGYDAAQLLAAGFATTSADFWKTQNNFFSTTSVAYWDSTQARWSTTSSDYWKSLSNFFSTTSADYWETQQTARNADNLGDNSIEDLSDVAAMTEMYGNILGWNGSNWTNMATTSLGLPTFADLTASAGGALSVVDWYATTTDGLDEGSTNRYFTDARADSYVHGSSTIPKTYTNNTFSGTTAFTNSVTIGSLTGPLQAQGGLVSATTSIGVTYGGTGLTVAPSYGQVLLGNAASGYTLSATSSLGFPTFSDLTSKVDTSRVINTTYPLLGGGDLSSDRTLSLAFGTTTANAWSSLQFFAGSASSTALSALDYFSVGRTATSTLQGGTAGTSTIQGFLNVVGTNSTSTFSGGLAATYLNLTGSSATSTFANGLTLSGGCFAVNGVCVGTGSGVTGGAANKVAFFTDTTTLSNNTLFHFDPMRTAMGIGTTTPKWTLTLASSTAPQLALTDGLGSSPWTLRSTSGNLYFATSSPTTFATSSTPALVVQANGTVGVGTSTPVSTAKLDVYGDTILSGGNRYLNFATTTGTNGYGFRDNNGVMEFKNANGTWQSVTTATTGPSFSVHKNGSDQTVTAGVTTLVTWSTETFDTNNNFASNRFTPTVPGKYLINLSINCPGLTSDRACVASVRKNGSGTFSGTARTGSYDTSAIVTVIIDMNGSTDYIEAYALSEATTIAGGSTNTYFTGALLAPVSQTAGGWTNDNTQSYLIDTTDKVGIGTSTPYAGLTVWAQGSTNATRAFEIANSASTTLASVLADGTTYFSGNVGVGTTTPSAKFSIHANNGETNTTLFSIASSTAATTRYLFTVTNSALVGVGTSSPAAKLDVSDALGLIPTGTYLQITGGTPGYSGSPGTSIGVRDKDNTANFFTLKSDYSLTLNRFTSLGNSATSFKITSLGYVGIGTSSPAAKLDVATDDGSVGWSARFLSPVHNGGILVGSRLSQTGALQAVNTAGIAKNLILQPDGGNVGIGTTTPGFKLSVYGGIGEFKNDSTPPAAYIGANSSGGFLSLYGPNVGNSMFMRYDSNNNIYFANTYGNTVFQSGNLGIGTDSPNQGKVEVKGGTVCVDTNSDDNASSCIASESDERLKKNIVALDATSSLDVLTKLRPVSFDWRTDDPEVLAHYPLISRFASSTHSVGLIAQEVQEVFPLAIEQETVGDRDVQYFQLDYEKFIPLLISGVKEMYAMVTDLRDKVAVLFKSDADQAEKIAALEARIAELEGGAERMVVSHGVPIIQVQGANPATIMVGSVYSDLGALITGPTSADMNLGLLTFVDGVRVAHIQLDTSHAAEYHIEYVATNESGTATTSRTVRVTEENKESAESLLTDEMNSEHREEGDAPSGDDDPVAELADKVPTEDAESDDESAPATEPTGNSSTVPITSHPAMQEEKPADAADEAVTTVVDGEETSLTGD